MGVFDRFKNNPVVDKVSDVAETVGDKVGDVAESVGDKVADGVDKATDFVDDKTGGKIHDQLEKVDNLAEKMRGDDEADVEASDEASDSTEDE